MPANQWIFIILFIIFTFRWFFFPHTRSFLLGKILKLTPQGRIKFFQNITNILETSSSYFRALSPEAKKTFLTRCINFNNSIRYIGMEGLTVTEEMRWRLAAAAVQITFGFKNFSLSHYHTIKIFPETFYSRMHDRYLKGGTSTSGVFFFSWKDFVEGYNDSTDRYNLGLHEMGHALRLQLLHGSDFDDRFADYADKWIDIARPEFESMSSNESAFLRSYAAVNMEEFFAVCVEHFFEVPEEFKKHLPDIYNHLCFLLNQDPSRSNDDYRLSPTFITDINSDSGRTPIPLALPRNYKYHNWHWSFNVIIVGIFIAFPIVISLYGYVLFRPLHVFLIVALAAAILSGFQNYFQSKGIYLFRHLMLFAT
ncbi:MAG TPA: zinc-dependent peptidase, partial [Bacteroidia bacterium]|nr:zinc-dependent peptidase [Bacteroidia bacterium]